MAWPFGNGVKKRWLEVRMGRLKADLSDEKILTRMKTYCLTSERKELSHINPAKLAKEWQMPLQEVVSAFLLGTKHQIFTLHYLMQCGGCKGNARMAGLAQLKGTMVCPACKHKNTPELDHSVEIFFSIHADLANITPDITPLGSAALRAIEVLNTDTFRQHFESDKPLPGEHITIQSLTFLFTDLSGSTATYERLGDDGAYRIVREHFTLLFDIIRKNNGTTIKTIGDAVMATFTHPPDAINAAIEAKEAFRKFNKRRDIKGAASLKVGIHTGPCLAVTLNSRLDFFGGTVNKAARVQSLAEKDQICITDETLLHPESAPLLETHTLLHKQVPVKGIKEPVQVSVIK